MAANVCASAKPWASGSSILQNEAAFAHIIALTANLDSYRRLVCQSPLCVAGTAERMAGDAAKHALRIKANGTLGMIQRHAGCDA